MRRGVKVIVWAGVFTACAGAGAYVAAHTNPFPPGVEDPGARPTTPAPTSTPPTNERWNLVMESATRHDLHVGGSCRSGWRTTGIVTIHPDGSVTGQGRAKLKGWGCEFPVAQVQTRAVQVSISGTSSAERVVIRFSISGSSPEGSQDLGGFTATLTKLAPGLSLGGLHADTVVHAARPDGDLGRYVDDGKVQLACSTGC